MVELTAVPRSSAVNKSLLSFVFGRLCRHARGDGDTQLLLLVNKAMTGHVIEKAQFLFYNAKVRRYKVPENACGNKAMTGHVIEKVQFVFYNAKVRFHKVPEKAREQGSDGERHALVTAVWMSSSSS